MIKRLLLIGVALMAAGCATTENRYGAEKLATSEVTPEAAFIVISTGAPEKCVSTSTFLRLKDATEPYDGKDLALLSVDGYSVKSDFSDHQGHLHVIKLAPGSYYLAAWIANPYVKPVRVPKVEFSVSAGELLYLGEYFMSVSCVWNPVVHWRDQQERDFLLLSDRNQALAARAVTKRVAKFNGYAVYKNE